MSRSSPSCIRNYKARLHEERALNSARLREQLQRLHVRRIHGDLVEEERKRDLHDAVRRAALDGEGGGIGDDDTGGGGPDGSGEGGEGGGGEGGGGGSSGGGSR